MKRLILTSTVITGLFVCGILNAEDQPPGKTNASVPGISESSKTFTAAFNRGDAKAVAAHWTEDGDYVDENGQKYHGREAIEQEYKKFFTANTGVKLKLEVESLRKIDENNAIEDGYATLDPLPQGIPARSRYTAMHTKKDGKWLMTAVRDSVVQLPANSGRLEDLDFLVGTWSVEQDGTQLETTCRWINNKNLLERWYTARKGEKTLSHGRQMIGWDPLAGRIVSWTFTSEGGFAAGAWAPHEGGWIVATVGVMQDGTLTSSTDVWSQPNKESVSWKSVNRTKGDTALPDMQEVVLRRKTK
jgi:uncharacterized protein (TIGR02246 family)